MANPARVVGLNLLLGSFPVVVYAGLIFLEHAKLLASFSTTWLFAAMIAAVVALAWSNRGLFSRVKNLWARRVLGAAFSACVVLLLFIAGLYSIAASVGVPP
jgi:hypothetical protein